MGDGGVSGSLSSTFAGESSPSPRLVPRLVARFDCFALRLSHILNPPLSGNQANSLNHPR